MKPLVRYVLEYSTRHFRLSPANQPLLGTTNPAAALFVVLQGCAHDNARCALTEDAQKQQVAPDKFVSLMVLLTAIAISATC